MKTKRLLPLLLVLVLLLALAVPAAASSEEAPAASEGETPLTTGALSASEHVFDRADLLTDKEEAELRVFLDSASQNRGCDYVVVAETSVGEENLEGFAREFINRSGFADDCVLLLVDMESAMARIETTGRAEDAITDLDPIFDFFLGDLADGQYLSGFEKFVKASDRYLERYDRRDEPVDRLVDNAGLLTAEEAEQLRAHLDALSAKRACDYVIVTENSIGGDSLMNYADDYYDHNGFADDGVLLLLVMDVRDAWISTAGRAIYAIGNGDAVFDRFIGDISDGNYYEGFREFAAASDEYVAYSDAHGGSASDVDPYDDWDVPQAPQEPQPFSGGRLIGALAIGLLVTLIATGSMRSQLKSVRAQAAAADYVRSGSFSLNDSRDVFLYSTVTRVARPKESSSSSHHGGGGSHFSSSGVSHGGGGRHF
jgi:uncharacterized protein